MGSAVCLCCLHPACVAWFVLPQRPLLYRNALVCLYLCGFGVCAPAILFPFLVGSVALGMFRFAVQHLVPEVLLQPKTSTRYNPPGRSRHRAVHRVHTMLTNACCLGLANTDMKALITIDARTRHTADDSSASRRMPFARSSTPRHDVRTKTIVSPVPSPHQSGLVGTHSVGPCSVWL